MSITPQGPARNQGSCERVIGWVDRGSGLVLSTLDSASIGFPLTSLTNWGSTLKIKTKQNKITYTCCCKSLFPAAFQIEDFSHLLMSKVPERSGGNAEQC